KKGPKEVRNKEASASAAAIPEPGQEPAGEELQGPRVFRVNHTADRKPMTLEEALMEMEKDGNYVIYRDAQTDRLAVLLRRRDGNFDLIES
ncbi:MAG: sigma 54 modulation/S30EA ribosomal C-terminal domain-containing protein, partial [Bryobacteraceae bacterium]